MIDLFLELSFIWIHVGILLPILACLAYENIKLHRMHVKMKRPVRKTLNTGRMIDLPPSPVTTRVRPKIPYFRDKSCQDDDELYFVV
ncbi:hypothetical protein [Shouchella lehensis]|uniref:Uncharacterized protein n=1 Tax=Shouchella lehensis TaxID=300825 RepID=A0A4Y7WFW7_9BACI|nr:hypothetical protein [Shouchella lehensis]MBG9785199.1 hypothetical protein [Shouchella lehensis]TES46638.1 hypothetical protein E2L03_18310 [Shouchella lehensis]